MAAVKRTATKKCPPTALATDFSVKKYDVLGWLQVSPVKFVQVQI